MKTEDFDKLWDLLIINYGGTHNEQKRLSYHYLKEYSVRVVSEAIEKVIRNNRYFPNVNEILAYIPNTQVNESEINEVIPYWMKNPEVCVAQEMSEEEQKEMKELLKEFEGDDDEIH